MIPGCIENGAPTNYSYDLNHKHAVASAGGATYQYDANGNMTNRNGDALTYDAENRLVSVVKGGVTTSFAYNGDGTRVKRSASNAGTMYYIGNYFEVWVPNSGTTTFNKYYYFGSQRVAARIASTLFYFQGDHLGSSSIAMTQAGTSFYSRQMYYPYGAPRTTEGSALPTDNTFTGQKSDDSTGLMFYNARYYDAALGRFIQPDTIVPNPLNPQSLNRFAYVLNNPLKYIDPTGHVECWDEDCDGGTHDYGDDGGSGGGKGGDADLDGDGVADDQQEGRLPTDAGGKGGLDCDLHPNAIGCGNNQQTGTTKTCSYVMIGCPTPTPSPTARDYSQSPRQKRITHSGTARFAEIDMDCNEGTGCRIWGIMYEITVLVVDYGSFMEIHFEEEAWAPWYGVPGALDRKIQFFNDYGQSIRPIPLGSTITGLGHAGRGSKYLNPGVAIIDKQSQHPALYGTSLPLIGSLKNPTYAKIYFNDPLNGDMNLFGAQSITVDWGYP